MFQIKVAEKIKTHILCSITFSFENRAVYEIMWKFFSEPEGHTGQCGACALHAGKLKLHTYTQNM